MIELPIWLLVVLCILATPAALTIALAAIYALLVVISLIEGAFEWLFGLDRKEANDNGNE